MAGYSQEELYTLWKGFREQHDARQILQDFSLLDRAAAKALIAEFEMRHAAELLNMENRGKER